MLLGITLLLMILLQTTAAKEYLGQTVEEKLSEALNTQVKVGRVSISLPTRLIADDVVIYDQANKEMVSAKRLSAAIELIPLTEGRVSIPSAQLFGATFSLYQANKGQPTNFQFVIDKFSSSDSTSKSSTDIHIGSLIIRRSAATFDRYDMPHETGHFDPNHIAVNDISGHFRLRALTNDSLNVEIKKLSLTEQSGLNLDRLALQFVSGRHETTLSDFVLQMPNTSVNIEKIEATHSPRQHSGGEKATLFDFSPNSLKLSGAIYNTHIHPSDFAFILPILSEVRPAISLTTYFDSKNGRINLKELDLETSDNSLRVNLDGWIKPFSGTPAWHLNINKLAATQQMLNFIGYNIGDTTSVASQYTRRLGYVEMEGKAESLYGNDLKANIQTHTAIGSVTTTADLKSDNTFTGKIAVNTLGLNVLTSNDKLGNITADIQLNGVLPEGKAPKIAADGIISDFEYCGYKYANINLSAKYSENNIKGHISSDDTNANMTIEGMYDTRHKTPVIKLEAAVRNINPKELRLTDKWSDTRFSGDLEADIAYSNINDATGILSIKDFQMEDGQDNYSLRSLNVISNYDQADRKYLNIDCDFGSARIVGDYDYTTIAQSVLNIMKQKMPVLANISKTHKHTNNDFTVLVQIENSEWCKRLLGIPLQINEFSELYVKVDDKANDLRLSLDAPAFTYDGDEYYSTNLNIWQVNDTLKSTIRTNIAEIDGSQMQVRANADIIRDSLITKLKWGNNKNPKTFSGLIKTTSGFATGKGSETLAHMNIHPSEIIINDAKWNIMPATIDYYDKNIRFGNFKISHDDQMLTLHGTLSDSDNDSLTVSLKDINVKYILDLVRFRSVSFSGQATGTAVLKTPFSNLSATASLNVEQFKFQNGNMGTLHANAMWNKTENQIDIDAIADGGEKSKTYINGYISPTRKDINLGIKADGTNIEFLQSFTKSFAKDIAGTTRGFVRLAGPLSGINLVGDMVVDGEVFFKQLGCKYYLRNDSVKLTHNQIELLNIPIFDKHNRSGRANGYIYHKNLSRVSYDLSIDVNNLLVYDFKDFGENTFYGTVHATGNARIKGDSDQFTMDAYLTPDRNSSFTYNISDQNNIANREFISWNDVTPRNRSLVFKSNRNTRKANTKSDDHPSSKRKIQQSIQQDDDLRLNFIINANPNVAIRLLMNSATNDYITFYGNGSLTASYYNKGAFTMFGTYTIERGTYEMTIQDILKKNFSFNPGGTLVFGGDPFYADLNLQAVHTVNGVSLSDLNIGNSYKTGTTRVNCLMNIGGQAMRPEVTFDIDLPTASSDERQMVRSVLNSEDLMNQQVVYLLGIGRFYPQGTNNSTTQGDNRQDETTLAMQSLLSGTISGQISNMLNNVINSNNWSFGANISTGNAGWDNAEYEGLLSGRLLNNRLLINGQFGYRDNASTDKKSFIGDFDVRYLLLPNGNLAVRIYNQTNDRYFTKSSLSTQGVGLILKKDFSTLNDLFGIKRKKKSEK